MFHRVITIATFALIGCSNRIPVTDPTGLDTDTDPQTDTDTDTDADTDADTEPVFNCRDDYRYPPFPDGECLEEPIYCGDLLWANNARGSTHYDMQWYDWAGNAGSWGINADWDAPERSYHIKLLSGQSAEVTLYSPCDDLVLRAFRTRDECVEYNPGAAQAPQALYVSRSGSNQVISPINMTGGTYDYEYTIVVDGLEGAVANYELKVECFQ